MLKLIDYVVKQFAENDYEIKTEEKENSIEVTVLLVESDMGKVIGKQGKIAKAIRTLVKAYNAKGNKKYNIEIKEKA